MSKHWWDNVDADWRRYQEANPDDDRDILEVAESGDWQRWHDAGEQNDG